MNEYKTCLGCHATLPFSEYHKHPKGAQGLNPKCKTCKRIADKTSRDKKPYKNAVNSLRFRELNPDYKKNWAKEHPDKISMANARRRARILDNGIFDISAKEISELYASSCFYCGSFNNIQLDHVMPIAKGGTHSIGNLVAACSWCNQSKKDLTLMEWRMSLSRRGLSEFQKP
jgi:5-methylcytosine-specific restriction endonuclease McrA